MAIITLGPCTYALPINLYTSTHRVLQSYTSSWLGHTRTMPYDEYHTQATDYRIDLISTLTTGTPFMHLSWLGTPDTQTDPRHDNMCSLSALHVGLPAHMPAKGFRVLRCHAASTASLLDGSSVVQQIPKLESNDVAALTKLHVKLHAAALHHLHYLPTYLLSFLYTYQPPYLHSA